MANKSNRELYASKSCLLFIWVMLSCFVGGKGDSPPETYDSDSSLSPMGKLILYAAAIGTFILLGIWLLYCALRPSTRCKSAPEVDPQPSTHHIQFEAQELSLATRGYHEGNLIGSTQWGCVFKGILQDGLVVAIKRLNLNNSAEANKSFFEVSNALTGIRHRNLVRILGFSIAPDPKQLVMDYVDCQSLEQHLHPNCNLSWETRRKIAQGTARALEPLLSDYGIASLIDKYHDSSSAFRGFSGYAAPECKRSEPITEKSDVYSYGLMLLELLTLKRPTSEDVSADLPGWIRDKVTDGYAEIFDPAITTAATETRKKKIKKVLGLALMCTRHDPQSRPSMKEVLEMLIQLKSFKAKSNAVVNPGFDIEKV